MIHFRRLNRTILGIVACVLLILLAGIIGWMVLTPENGAYAQVTGMYLYRSDGQNPVNVQYVTEGGATDTYTVGLHSQPTANVTITMTVPYQPEDLSMSPSSLTFTPSNWNTPQIVTVSAVDDNILEGPETRTINNIPSSTDPNYNSGGGGMVVYITDNDVASVTITETAGSTAVTEDGATDTYMVGLGSQPYTYTTVAINISGGSQLTVSPSTLNFTPSNWTTPQTVTVSAVNDVIDENDIHTGTLTHTVTSNNDYYNGLAVPDLSVNITDNDTAGVTVAQSGDATAVTEGGATDTYTIVLKTQPTGNVVITPSVSAQLTLNPLSVTFTSGNWSTPQTITVTAVNDFVVEGTHSVTTTHVSSSDDSFYNGVSIDSVLVEITDNDIAGVTVTQSNGTTAVTEGGATDSYTVVLTSQPAANVTITPSISAQLTLSPLSATFTSLNWSTPKTFTVTAVDDSAVEAAHVATITHTSASGDANYNGIAITSVSVSITDNDSADSPPADSPPEDSPPVSPPPAQDTPSTPPPAGTSAWDDNSSGGITPSTHPASSTLNIVRSGKAALPSVITKRIGPIVQLMVDKKSYVEPANKELNVSFVTKRYFAIQSALALAGRSCGSKVSFKNCYAIAIAGGDRTGSDWRLFDPADPPSLRIRRGEYMELLLNAKKIPLLDDSQIATQICKDVTIDTPRAKVIATAKAYGILKPSPRGYCKPNLGMAKYKALTYAARADAITKKDITRMTKKKK